MRKVIKANLMKMGAKEPLIYEASDGERGLEAMMLAEEINLVVLDLDIPGFHGLDFIKGIKKNSQYKDAYVVTLAEQLTPLEQKRFKEVGVSSFIGKPFDKNNFFQLMQPVVETLLAGKVPGTDMGIPKAQCEALFADGMPKVRVVEGDLILEFAKGEIHLPMEVVRQEGKLQVKQDSN